MRFQHERSPDRRFSANFSIALKLARNHSKGSRRSSLFGLKNQEKAGGARG
jgi:hypothetical protein